MFGIYLQKKLPEKKQLLQVFTFTMVIFFFWSTISQLYSIPGWIIRNNIWDLVGISSYVYIFSFFESIVFTIYLIVLFLIFPKDWVEGNFLELGFLLLLFTLLYFSIYHINIDAVINVWGLKFFSLYLIIYFILTTVIVYINSRHTHDISIARKLISHTDILGAIFSTPKLKSKSYFLLHERHLPSPKILFFSLIMLMRTFPLHLQ